MTSNARNLMSPEETQEGLEGVVDEKPGEYRVAQDVPSSGQERRHETPLRPCQCGCGRPLDSRGRGTPRRYATPACRTRAWRRRREPCAGAPAPTPASGTGKDQGRVTG